MHEIAGKGSSCRITPSGVITPIDIEGIDRGSLYRGASVPAYSFIYEEYTKTNPACIHFNDNEAIVISSKTESFIEFTKTFTHPHTNDEVRLKYQVSALDRTIDIKIQVLTETPLNYRYGMVIPLNSPTVHLYNNIQFHNPLVNFHRLWDRKWPDQTYVDAPIVSIGGQSNCYSIFCPIDYNSQFFFHKQHADECVRVSTSTHSSMSLHIVIQGHSCHAKEAYVRYFPESDHYVNFWKVTHNKIQKVHGIQLTYNSGGMYKDIKFDPVPTERIDATVQMLDEELAKYNCSLSRLGLKEIILCSNLRRNDNKMSGILARNSNIFIDCDINYNPRSTIHHEIFHLILNVVDVNLSHFEQLSNVPDDMKLDNVTEDMAELFARMMADSVTLQSVMGEYPHVEQRCKIIESIIMLALGTKLVWRKKQSFRGPMFQDADISIMDPRSHGAFSEKKSEDTTGFVSVTKQVILLYGLPQSGVKLLADYLEQTNIKFISSLDDLRYHVDDPVIYYPYMCHYSAQDIVNVAERINGRVLWVVRNPRYCENEQWFDIWIKSYSLMLTLKHSKMIKYESLVMNDKQVVTELCDYLGCEIREFKSLIDYDKVNYNTNTNDSLFLKYWGYPILSATEYK